MIRSVAGYCWAACVYLVIAGACHTVIAATVANNSSDSTIPPADAAPFEALTGTILFQSDRDGDWEIYVMNADGSHTIQLTHNTCADEYPVWSPDGQQIAFKSNRDGNWEIYVMHADGSDQRRLTDHSAQDEDPAWTPDGLALAFHSDRESNQEIYCLNLADRTVSPLTRTIGRNILPAWSPDGHQLAYTGNRYLGWNVYTLDLRTHRDTRLTDGHGACRPDWSPDGQQIAYVSQKADGKGDIWLMATDGTAHTRITFDDEQYDYYPAWSPDGRYLAYAKTPDKEHGNWEIYVMTADGQHHRQITQHAARDKFPDWAPGHIAADDVRRRETRYEAEFAPRTIGAVVADPQASGQSAVYSAKGGGEGFLMYGPYQPYSAGTYWASFIVKIERAPQKGSILRVDVVTDTGATMLASRELDRVDIQAQHIYQRFDVPFALPDERILEFRVYTFATADIWVDNITVTRTEASQ